MLTKRLLASLALLGASLCAHHHSFALAPAPTATTLNEGFVNPIGFYEASPTFSWVLPVTAQVQHQSAYQIQVFSDAALTSTSLLWDSGQVKTDQSTWVSYAGKPMPSRTTAFWRVRYWDQSNNSSDWSPIAHFELGLLHNKDWQASWIGLPKTAYTTKTAHNLALYHPLYLRKGFTTADKVKKARLHITALGVFEAHINGTKVGKDLMTPGWTPYHKKIETLTYDVSTLITNGENLLSVILAEGWHSGRLGWMQNQWVEKNPPRLLAQLEIEFANGTTQRVNTDGSWKGTLNGPIRSASIYEGETYDANFDLGAWQTPRYDQSQWQAVVAEPVNPNIALTPKRHNTVKAAQLLAPISVKTVKPGTVLFDFGQNMVGVPQLNLPVKKGNVLKLRHAEIVLPNGDILTDNLRTALSTNFYTANKDMQLNWQPTFTFHGFRYLEISGLDPKLQPSLEWVKGVVMHSDFLPNGTFSTSNKKLNQLQSNINWGLRGNFLDIPTDCPQRDERLGWTGDAQVFAPTSLFNTHTHSFWKSWLESMRLDQFADGAIPVVIPDVPASRAMLSPGWSDAGTIIPWEVYFRTGDLDTLAENYNMMLDLVNYYQSKSKDHTLDLKGFGDWVQPYPQAKDKERQNFGDTAMPLIATAFYARSIDLTLRAAKLLNKVDDVQRLSSLHAQVKAAFQQRFFTPKAELKEGLATQTAYLLALGFDLLSADLIAPAKVGLLQQIKLADNHLRTGFLGTPLLAPVLDQLGETDLMYTILMQETYPSWLHTVNEGATTMWERWDSYARTIDPKTPASDMNSFNHYSYGAIGEWMYERIAGIKPIQAGYKRTQFKPAIAGPLNSASANYQSPYGLIESAWEKNGTSVKYAISLPANTLGDVILPTTVDKLMVNGAELSKHKGIKVQKSERGLLYLTVTPGRYVFNF